MQDPNWFYSSLAQCTAALIGLLSAVLATRTQQQIIEVAISKNQTLKLILNLNSTLMGRADELKKFIAFSQDRILKIREALSDSISEITISSEVFFWGGRSIGPPHRFQVNQSIQLEYEKLNSLANQLLALIEAEELSTVNEIESKLLPLLNTFKKELSSNSQSVVRELNAEVEGIQKSSLNLIQLSNTRLPLFFSIVVLWLCVFGLILPLSYLSAFQDSSKCWLMVAFILGIIGVPGFLFVQFNQLFQMKKEILGTK